MKVPGNDQNRFSGYVPKKRSLLATQFVGLLGGNKFVCLKVAELFS